MAQVPTTCLPSFLPVLPQGGHRNLILARTVLTYLLYHPWSALRGVRAPTLLVAGKQDIATPPVIIKWVAMLLQLSWGQQRRVESRLNSEWPYLRGSVLGAAGLGEVA